jgi:hypothetical protein
MGTGANPSFTWSAAGELAANRWEIMGAMAPAVSGVPLNEYTAPGPASALLSPATYGQPSAGGTINLTWMPGFSPPVSAATADQWTDAVLIFSQDPPTVTGVSVTPSNQQLTGVALDCTTFPWYVPTSMSYNKLVWSATAANIPISGFAYYEIQRMDTVNTDWETIAEVTDPMGVTSIGNTQTATDTFARSVSNGWGNADTGQAWTMSGGLAANFSVGGGSGQVSETTVNVNRFGQLAITNTANVDATIFTSTPVVATGASITNTLCVRMVDTNNMLMATCVYNTTGLTDLLIVKRIAGVETTLATATNVTTYAGNGGVWIRFQAVGVGLRAKLWNDGDPEPSAWTLYVADGSLLTAAQVGTYSKLTTGNTNPSPVNVQYDNLSVRTLVPTFNDYEARVGVQSSYRIRAVNELLFEGPFSSTAIATLTAPGVTGQGMSATSHALLFTTNEDQSGNSNLAYAIAGESNGVEQFNFPEAGFTQFQFMYGRDFQTAFRPLERGGVTFNRTVLVQAAAISPPTLPNFTSLRDLAWDSLPYVCVRDEDGNQWFANVTVPQGRVMTNNREIYLADITIVQVTNTPSIVVI